MDRIIREKLQNLETDNELGKWDLFEKQLDEAEALDQANEEVHHVDELVRSQLQAFEVEYDAASWPKMSEKLEDNFSWRRKLYRYKIAEAAIIILALITSFNYLPLPKGLPILSLNKDNTEKAERPQNDNTKAIAGINNNASESDLPPEDAAAIATASEDEASLLLAEENSNASQTAIPRPIAAVQKVKTVKEQSEEDDQNLVFGTKPDPVLVSKASILTVDLLDAPEETNLSISGLENVKNFFNVRFGMFGSANYDYIVTPYDRLFNQAPDAQWAQGYGGGFTLGFALGKRWELETGAIYAAKKYKPNTSSEVRGSFRLGYVEKSIEDIELNMMQVPLNMRYNVVDSKKWTVYALGGIAVNMAFQANYDKKQVVTLGPAFGEGTLDQIDNDFKIDEKRFSDGLFEGGNFKENSYFTSNIGLGIERFVTPQWSVFVQPTFHQPIISKSWEGLGPNRDRISTSSLYIGTKVSLW